MKVKYIWLKNEKWYTELELWKTYKAFDAIASYWISIDWIVRHYLKDFFEIVEDFKFWEEVEVSNDNIIRIKNIYIEESENFYITRCLNLNVWCYKYCKKAKENKFKLWNKVKIKRVDWEFIITWIINWHYLINSNLEHWDNLELLDDNNF